MGGRAGFCLTGWSGAVWKNSIRYGLGDLIEEGTFHCCFGYGAQGWVGELCL